MTHDYLTSSTPGEAPPQQQGGPTPAQKTDILAILGFVFAFVFWPAGIVLSALGLRSVRRLGTGGRGLALAGLILSIVFGVAVAAFGASMAVGVVQQREAATQAGLRYDLRVTQVEMDVYLAATGAYPGSLTDLGATATTPLPSTVSLVSSSTDTYCLVARSDDGTSLWVEDDKSPTTSVACT